MTPQAVPGTANSRSRIRLAETGNGMSRFELSPLTGRTHQLRVHMSGLGFPILHDRLYPELQPQGPDDYKKPLQLLAKSVRFRDPVSGSFLEFESPRRLLW